MIADGLQLTTWFGERERVDGAYLADALARVYARHGIGASLVLRGAEGFGAKHRLRTDRLLTLSEDLPMASIAVDRAARVEPAAAEVAALPFAGLVTLERARLLGDPIEPIPAPPPHEQVKLTVYLGRRERARGLPADQAVVALLRRRGMAGASVLLGVDGTLRGVRRRARFFARNADVPLMVIGVGDGRRAAALLPELGAMLTRPLITLERVQVCKRAGERLAEPRRVAAADTGGLGLWQKLTVYAGEQSRHRGAPLSPQLVRALREAGAAGATSLRGIWGYRGEHVPHGDSLWQLRRRVPVLTVTVDAPERIRQWFAIVDAFTDEAGLVTSEIVPAFRATGPGFALGGLRLARPCSAS